MRTVSCVANVDGFGPIERPNIRPGEVIKVVYPDGSHIIVLVKQLIDGVDIDNVGNRCRCCSMCRHIAPIGGSRRYTQCLINDRSLKKRDNIGAICTLPNHGFVVFVDPAEVLEEL